MKNNKTNYFSYQDNNLGKNKTISNVEIISFKNDIAIDIEPKRNLDKNIKNYNEYTPKSYNDDNSIVDKSQFFLFKLRISIVLCTIYLVLFLINIPKCPIKTGEEKNINFFINTNKTQNLHILINNHRFSFYKNKSNNDIKNTNNELYGYLLEFKIDKRYIIRWIIGFLYFVVRNICFVYSDTEKKNKNYIFWRNTDTINKFSCLIFPLFLFYYDIKNNNFSFINIKVEYIMNKEIYYYIMTNKHSSMNDYIEGIIPTLFYFLISIIYNGMELSLGKMLGMKSKITKLV